jgi:hypothetical protein
MYPSRKDGGFKNVTIKDRKRWLLAVLSAGTAVAMFATPIALADEDHGGHGGGGDGDDHRPQIVQVRDQDRDEVRDNEVQDENENEQVNMNAEAVRADDLVMAINNEVAMLSTTNADRDDEDVNGLDIEHVRTVSLSTLENGLTAAQITAVNSAVSANAGALQTFLAGTSTNAAAIDAALNAAGISPASVMAILLRGDNLIVVTS